MELGRRERRCAENKAVLERGKKRSAKIKVDSTDERQCSEKENQDPSIESVNSLMPNDLDGPITEKIGTATVNDARQNTLEKIPKPGIKGHTDDYIKRMQREFGKKASSAIPTRILPTLTKAQKSVGFILCGNVTGTCFLLAENIIIMSQHVLDDINAARSRTTDSELHRAINVYFKYEYPQRLGECVAEVDETRELCSGQSVDYVICFLKPAPLLSHLLPLGGLVRSPVSCSGLVILVGHPENQNKALEICDIIPKHNWHATLCERASKAKQYCEQHHEECHLLNKSALCVHIHEDRYLQGDHPHHLPYDTSFFHGSSGSPVFNDAGHIVAMHNQGYPFSQGSKKVSLMEFGLTFDAIYRDVKEQLGDEMAKLLFPEC